MKIIKIWKAGKASEFSATYLLEGLRFEAFFVSSSINGESEIVWEPRRTGQIFVYCVENLSSVLWYKCTLRFFVLPNLSSLTGSQRRAILPRCRKSFLLAVKTDRFFWFTRHNLKEIVNQEVWCRFPMREAQACYARSILHDQISGNIEPNQNFFPSGPLTQWISAY